MTKTSDHTPQHAGRAYFLLVSTMFCWGANAVFGRMAVGEISPMMLVSLRWVAVLALLAVFARDHLRRDWRTLRSHLLFIAMMGVLGFTGFNALFYVAAHSTTAVNIGILQGAIPIFVLLGAFVTYRTQVTRMQLIGVIITLLGVATVASGGNLARLATLTIKLGDGLMLVACLLYAGYAVGLRRRPPVSALGMFTVMAGAAFIASLPLTVAEAALDQLQWPTLTGWIIVALVAVFPSFLAQIFFIQSVEMIGPGRAGVFVNLVPVFASIMAVVFLGETFAVFHAVALGLVLGGIWLSEHALWRRIS